MFEFENNMASAAPSWKRQRAVTPEEETVTLESALEEIHQLKEEQRRQQELPRERERELASALQ